MPGIIPRDPTPRGLEPVAREIPSREAGNAREPLLQSRAGARVFSYETYTAPSIPNVPSLLGAGMTPAGTSNIGPAESRPLYGDLPFGTLADLYLRMFGPDRGYSGGQPAQIAAVPVSGGGSNTGILLLLLAVGGAAIYYFYYR